MRADHYTTTPDDAAAYEDARTDDDSRDRPDLDDVVGITPAPARTVLNDLTDPWAPATATTDDEPF